MPILHQDHLILHRQDLVRQLESKSATIEAMELEISNLRAQVCLTIKLL